jgi:serine/threonine-protein kinase
MAAVVVLAAAATAGWLASRADEGRSGRPGAAGPAVTPAPGGSAQRAVVGGAPAAVGSGATPSGPTAADGRGGPAVPGAPPVTPGPATTPTPTPATPTATSPPGTTATTPASSERVLTSPGGTVTATCPSPETAHILSWSPARSYHLETADTAPGPSPAATFRHGTDQVTMTITCTAGTPTAAIS